MADKTKIEIEIDFGKSKSESAAVGAKIQAIGKDSKKAMDAVKKSAQTATADSTSRFKRFGEAVKTSFSGIGSKISGVFSGIKGKFSGLMGDIKQGIGQGIGQYFGSGISGMLTSVVTAPLTALLERITALKSSREAMRDLEGQQQRLIDMDKKLGYTTMDSIQKQMDLKIQMEQLGFANRNLTEEDKKRESAIQKVRDCYTSMKDTLADAMMSVVDVALPYLESLTDTFEAYLPNAIGVFMGIMKNVPGIIDALPTIIDLVTEKAKNIFSYAFGEYIPNLFTYVFTDYVPQLFTNWLNYMTGIDIGYTCSTWANSFSKFFLSLIDMAIGAFKSIFSAAYSLGKNLAGAIMGTVSWGDVIGNTLSDASKSFKEGSPLMKAAIQDIDANQAKMDADHKKKMESGSILPEWEGPSWNRQKSEREKELEGQVKPLIDQIGKDIDDSTKEAAANLAKNKAYRKEVTDGLNAPITDTEVNQQNMQRQAATTSDAVGAFMRINNAVANRNPALLAAEKQIKHDDKLANEQAKRDETTQKKLDGVETAIRETAKDKSLAARGFAVVANG